MCLDDDGVAQLTGETDTRRAQATLTQFFHDAVDIVGATRLWTQNGAFTTVLIQTLVRDAKDLTNEFLKKRPVE